MTRKIEPVGGLLDKIVRGVLEGELPIEHELFDLQENLETALILKGSPQISGLSAAVLDGLRRIIRSRLNLTAAQRSHLFRLITRIEIETIQKEAYDRAMAFLEAEGIVYDDGKTGVIVFKGRMR